MDPISDNPHKFQHGLICYQDVIDKNEKIQLHIEIQ